MVPLARAAGPAIASSKEHVTLRNGFELDCHHHEALDAEHTRLFFTADAVSYQDISAAQIARIEIVAEPLPTPPPIQPIAPLTQADVATLLSSAGAAHNIDAELLASVVHTESAGHAQAVSPKGARGLMQLMPGTAREMGVTDAGRADQNINGGTAYLDALLHRYKDNLSLALAAYNAGPGAVDRYHGIPPFRETRAYVARVIRDFNRRKRASLAALAISR